MPKKANYPLNDSETRGLFYSSQVRNITGFIQEAYDTDNSSRVLYSQEYDLYNLMEEGAAKLKVASDSSSDTEVVVTIQGVDGSWNEQTETVTLDETDSQTPVATEKTWGFVNNVSTAVNTAGDIYVGLNNTNWTAGVPDAPTDNYVISKVEKLIAHSDCGAYAVPAGKELFLKTFAAKLHVGITAASSAAADLSLYLNNGGGFTKHVRGSRLFIGENVPEDELTLKAGYVKVPEKTIILIKYYNNGAANTTMSANLTGLLFDKDEVSVYERT